MTTSGSKTTELAAPGAVDGKEPTQKVWDLGIRLYHWLLVVSLAGSWLTAELGVEYRETHFLFGYAAFGMIVFRILWGLIGTPYARFVHFLRGPARVIEYLQARTAGKPPPETYPGHNPAGGWAVLVLLLLVGIQAVTGLFADDDILYTGPWREAVSSSLSSDLTELHHSNFNLLLGFVALHVVAVLTYQFRLGERLLQPMFSGDKARAAFGAFQAVQREPWVRLLLAIGFAAAAVWLMLELAPEPSYDDYY